MPSVVVDDATLLSILTGRASAVLAETVRAGEVSTTGSWYYRLHRAIHDPASSGSLSAIVANLSPETRAVLFPRLDDLPPEIVVPGPRLVVPVMGALRLTKRVNHLTAEALAVALISNARIRVSIEARLLRDACQELAIPLEVVSPFE
jgi:hypothetical protein